MTGSLVSDGLKNSKKRRARHVPPEMSALRHLAQPSWTRFPTWGKTSHEGSLRRGSKAFRVKYPKAKPSKAEKMTAANESVSFEIAFNTDAGKREAMFTQHGMFVEEE